MKKSTSGFTLVEIVIVIVILAILVSIAIVSYNGSQARTRDARRKADITNIVKALELYYDANGSYPIANASGSIINGAWYTSGDTSWTTFANTLTGAKAIDVLPVDPVNNALDPLGPTGLAYGYSSAATYCGKAAGQWYLLTYRYEVATKERFTDGDCASNPIGDGYYNSTANVSYYRSVR